MPVRLKKEGFFFPLCFVFLLFLMTSPVLFSATDVRAASTDGGGMITADPHAQLSPPIAIPVQGDAKFDGNPTEKPCCGDPMEGDDNNSNTSQAGNSNDTNSIMQVVGLLAMVLLMKNSNNSSSSSGDYSGYNLKIVNREVAVIIDSRTKGSGSNDDTGDDDSSDDDDDGKNKPSGSDDDDDSGDDDDDDDDDGKGGQSGSDKDGSGNDIKNVFKSAVNTTNDIERTIVSSIPEVSDQLDSVRVASVRNPDTAVSIARARLVTAFSNADAADETVRNQQVLRVSSLAEAYGIGVATVAASDDVLNTALPAASKTTLDGTKQNGISKIKRSVPYTLMANAEAAISRAIGVRSLQSTISANYSNTQSSSVIKGNKGECLPCQLN